MPIGYISISSIYITVYIIEVCKRLNKDLCCFSFLSSSSSDSLLEETQYSIRAYFFFFPLIYFIAFYLCINNICSFLTRKRKHVLYTFSMLNVEEDNTEEFNHHSQISYRSQVLIHYEYEPRQHFESQ